MSDGSRFVTFHPGVETVTADEPVIARELSDTMLSICQKTYADSGHAIRSVHAKAHGLLDAEVAVREDLAPELAQGIFEPGRQYKAIIRLSSTPGDLLHDSVSTPRGLSVKILNVDGERLAHGLPGSTSQDFLTVNGKQFQSPSGKSFLRNLKGLALTTDRLEGAKKVLSAVFRTVEAGLEAVGTESTTLKTLGGHPKTHPLGESYYAQLPFRHGDYIARIAILPASDNLLALKDKPLEDDDDANAIRENVVRFFDTETAVWHIAVQLCTDLERMPIEDPTAIWDEEESPFVPVATLTAKPQAAYTEEKRLKIDDGMSFRPWNGVTAHQPLGSIMRLRTRAYDRSTAFRSERNQTPVTEPGCPMHRS